MRLADIPSRDILALLDRPGLKSMRDKLAALERLSPLRQSDTYKMVNSRGMEMAVVRVGGFGPSGITNTISYCHTSREGGVWRLLSEVLFIFICKVCPPALLLVDKQMPRCRTLSVVTLVWPFFTIFFTFWADALARS